jgi:hypothetical protein
MPTTEWVSEEVDADEVVDFDDDTDAAAATEEEEEEEPVELPIEAVGCGPVVLPVLPAWVIVAPFGWRNIAPT